MMREDFDFVTIDNYSKDMRGLSEQGAHIISRQRQEIDRLKKLVGALVHAAERLAITPHFMEYDYPIEQDYQPHNDMLVFRALPLSKSKVQEK